MANVIDVEAVRYSRATAWGAAIPLVIFGFGSAFQSEIFQVARGLAAYGEIYDVPLWARLVANLSTAALVGLGVWLLPVNPRRRLVWLAIVTGIVIVAVTVRCGLQFLLGVYSLALFEFALSDVAMGFVCGMLSVLIGMTIAEAFQRVRFQERAAAHQALRASAALDALQAEELRVRREVAEGLHGTVQQHLVLLGARVRSVVSELPVGAVATREHLAQLADIERAVDEIREYDVREMSQLLYPEGLDLGLTQSVRMMLRRVPSSIQVRTDIDEAVAEYDDPAVGRVPQSVRLLAVRLVEEAVSNALRHGNAGRIDVALRIDEDRMLALRVDDDGSGIPAGVVLSGLERLRERLGRIGGHLELGPGVLGGARVTARIPLGEAH